MDLSIIIVSYNTKKLLKKCIKSIIGNTRKINYEIIVVDNNSSDGSLLMLEKLKIKKSELILIKNDSNIGFGKANNQGMRKAKGKHILLLNSDTAINNNVLSKMMDWMDKKNKLGIASCALKNIDGSLQGTGGHFPDLFRVFSWMFFIEDIPGVDRLIKPFHPLHSKSPFYKGIEYYKKERELDWITAAFFLIKREVIKDIGYFDKDYFMYVEEVDYCFRAKKRGWKVGYNPILSITHLGGASSEKEFPILSEFEGIKIFYSKHMLEWQMPLLKLFLKGGTFLRVLLFGVLKGRSAANIYVKAFKNI